MARYLFEMELTSKAFAAFIKEPGDRGQANRAVSGSVGGELLAYYFSVGGNIIYTIMELPNEIAVEAVTMGILAGGAVTSIKCTGILTSAEAVEAMKMAGSTSYRPPSS